MFSPFVIPFLAGTASLFAVCLVKYVRWYRRFSPEQRSAVRKNIFTRKTLEAICEAFNESLLHHRIFKRNPVLGYMHAAIAFGWFLLIAVGAVEARLVLPTHPHIWEAVFLRYFVHAPERFYPYARLFDQWMDSLLLLVLSGVMLAFIKSLWHKVVGMKKVTRHTFPDLVAKYALWLIFPLRLLAESLTAALWENGGWLTQGLGNLFPAGLAAQWEYPVWFLYSLSLGAFFVAMPFTRYMHIFTEVPLIFFRRLGVREETAATGYTHYELNACSRCGICIDNCPLNRELGKTDVQPVYFLREVRDGNLLRDGCTNAATAEDCLLCGRCQSECPVGLDLLSIRRQMRQRGKPVGHCHFEGLSAHGVSEIFFDSTRTDPTRTDPTRSVSNTSAEMSETGASGKLEDMSKTFGRVGYFGGCMSHLTPGITESMKRIFHVADEPFWHIDAQKTICCGRPLYQQGFNREAEELRRINTELICGSGVKLLVTSCPICYQSFTKEYDLKGVTVMHHSEYIALLLAQGRLPLRHGGERVVYHDPCELGRGCGIYDEPRKVLEAVSTLLKAPEERERSLCCGHNLGDTRLEFEQQVRIREAALANLLSVKPDVIATACPMCKKALAIGNGHIVKDIAEIVAENLEVGFINSPLQQITFINGHT